MSMSLLTQKAVLRELMLFPARNFGDHARALGVTEKELTPMLNELAERGKVRQAYGYWQCVEDAPPEAQHTAAPENKHQWHCERCGKWFSQIEAQNLAFGLPEERTYCGACSDFIIKRNIERATEVLPVLFAGISPGEPGDDVYDKLKPLMPETALVTDEGWWVEANGRGYTIDIPEAVGHVGMFVIRPTRDGGWSVKLRS